MYIKKLKDSKSVQQENKQLKKQVYSKLNT